MSEQSKKMAEETTIIRCVVGSTVHGLALEGTDDRDEMGVCVEDYPSFGGFSPFEQYIYRTAAERDGKHDAPSMPGDLDLTIYSLKKFLRLAMQGNPTVLTLLYVPREQWLAGNELGAALQAMTPYIVSKLAGKRYLGYLESQRQRLLGEKGQKKVNRPELEEKYGYDTKYAMHMLRLGEQGVELLTTGKLSFPMPEPQRSYIRDVRQGKNSLDFVLQRAGDLERDIKDLLACDYLPEQPDRDFVETWMLDTYKESWR